MLLSYHSFFSYTEHRLFWRFKFFMKRIILLILCVSLCFGLCASYAGAVSPAASEGAPLPVSYGKSYTVTRSGCSPTAGRADNGRMLTDRLFASSRLSANDAGSWVGYTSNGGAFTVQIVLDLEMVYDNLSHFTVSFVQDKSAGVYFPRSVRYEGSSDGTRYFSLGYGECDCDLSASPYCGLFNLTTSKDISARYIRVTIEGGAKQSVYLCEVIVEGRAQLTLINSQAKEGGQYTDAQGVVYTLRNGKAVVTDYKDTANGSSNRSNAPSNADFNREGNYVLGAGSSNPVTVHAEFISHDNINFSNLSNDIRAIVIHNTATVEESTTAARYHTVLMSGRSDSSWHYTVDDKSTIYHSVPDQYAAWHAGSDENYASIGIELCVNGAPTNGGTNFIFSGAAYEKWVNERFLKTIENTAVLVAELLVRYDLPESAVIQHYDCSGKNCPQWMRYTSSNKSYTHDGDLWVVLKNRIHAYYTTFSANARAYTPASDVVLPEYLLFSGGLSYPVAEIASGAFAGKDSVLHSIALPDTLTKVALGAFDDSTGLKSVTVSAKHPTLYLRGTDLYDTQGRLIFTPYQEKLPIPTPSEDSGLWIERKNGEYWLLGLKGTYTLEELRLLYGAEEMQLDGDVIKTGALLQADGAQMRIVLQGDANGDGAVDANDYMLVKRYVLGTYALDPVKARAVMLTDGKTVSATDYLFIKRYVLGTMGLPDPIHS